MLDFHAAFSAVKGAMAGAFFGDVSEGVYSPSVQYTLYQMAKAALSAETAIDSVYLHMPNIHYLPCNPVNSESFADDVYIATSEPHGDIEATVTRDAVMPHVHMS